MNNLDWLIGERASKTAVLVNSILAEAVPRSYVFLGETEFSDLFKADPVEGQRLYWTELLDRAHWAAVSNLLRHQTWLESCKLNFEAGNLLGFVASLRGLVEAAADTCFSLSRIAPSLASDHLQIRSALSGELGTTILVAGELEESLIHFHFGRKLSKNEVAPESHKAETASRYLDSFSETESPKVKELYGLLCQVVHPAAHSVLWACSFDDANSVSTTTPSGQDLIMGLCAEHCETIESIAQISLNTSLLILKVLDRFDLPSIASTEMRNLNLSGIRAWQAIETSFK